MQNDHPNIHRNVHPPVVAMIFVVLAHLLGWFVRLPLSVPLVLQHAGFALVVIGFLAAVAAFVEFRKAHTTLDPHGSVKALVTGGIFRFTRNPIYFGFLLMVIGLPLNAGFYSGLAVAPFFMLTMERLVIMKEEAYLEEKFGEAYAGYKSRVRRWF